MNRPTRMKDSRGFTLIELIVIMAIIGLLCIGSLLGIGVLGYGNAKSSATRIKSLLDNVRVENMTKKGSYYLVIYQKDRDYYLAIETVKDSNRITVSREKLDLMKGEISYQNTDKTRYIVCQEPVEGADVIDNLEITFAKDTGGLKAGPDGEIVETIYVQCNNSSYKIHLVEATGRAYID